MIRGSPCKSNTRNTGKEGNMDHHKSTTGPQVLQAADRSTRVTKGSPQSPCNYSEPQPQLIGVAGAEGVLAARCTAAAGRGPSEASNGRLCSPSGVSHRSLWSWTPAPKSCLERQPEITMQVIQGAAQGEPAYR